jgi:hypothetical protein
MNGVEGSLRVFSQNGSIMELITGRIHFVRPSPQVATSGPHHHTAYSTHHVLGEESLTSIQVIICFDLVQMTQWIYGLQKGRQCIITITEKEQC